jgi:hypothetical protein
VRIHHWSAESQWIGSEQLLCIAEKALHSHTAFTYVPI